MKKRFSVIEHTADAGVVAYGADLKEVFINAAFGFFSLITDLRRVRASVIRHLEVRADDTETLLAAWLGEFIYLFDTEQLLFKRFIIADLTRTRLTGTAWGEKVDPRRHRLRVGVKAVTHHQLSIVQRDGMEARVIFDI